MCFVSLSQQSELDFPSTYLQGGKQRVSVSPGRICSGQSGKVFQNLISFTYLRRYITLATEDIVKYIFSSGSVTCEVEIEFLYVT